MSRAFGILSSERLRAAKPQPAPATRPPLRAPSNPDDMRAGLDAEIRNLVQRLFIFQNGHAPKAVAFCGVNEGAGCSWVCARAAEALAAQSQGRVCVMDADTRNPSLHDEFRMENASGFADALAGPRPISEFYRQTQGDHLWLITSGSAPANPRGMVDPARLKSRIAELREDFDHLLIDTPPMNLCTDAALLGQLADGVVLVIGSSSTRREAARMAKEELDAAGVKVLGAVLNRRTYPMPEAIYRRL